MQVYTRSFTYNIRVQVSIIQRRKLMLPQFDVINTHQTQGQGAATGRSCLLVALEDLAAGFVAVVIGLVGAVGHTAWDHSLAEVLPVHIDSASEVAVLGLADNLAFD